MPGFLVPSLGRRSARTAFAAAGLLLLAASLAVALQGSLGSQLARALAQFRDARPLPLWVAAGCFLATLVCSAGAWRCALRACGAELGLGDACARYGVGSLVNSVTPARLGDAVRLGLFARVVGRDGAWIAGGALGAVGAARALSQALLLVCAASVGALPVWPVLLLLSAVAAAAALAICLRHRDPRGRLARLLAPFRALGRSPATALRLTGWALASTAARVGAAAAVAAALGVHGPLVAALLVVPALDLAGQLPLTPGNVGITSAAVAMALETHGVPLATALSAGIAFHAVETAAGLAFGLTGVLRLARFPSPGLRLIALRGAAAGAALGLSAAFSATVFA